MVHFIFFLILNFGALAIGQIFTGPGVSSEWYRTLNQAPWTPPGWVFGAAWASLMVCFAIYMAHAWKLDTSKRTLVFLFGVQWILNVLWNPVFFHYHMILAALAIILLLTGIIFTIILRYSEQLRLKSLWALPYLLWLLVATSLNGFIYFNN